MRDGAKTPHHGPFQGRWRRSAGETASSVGSGGTGELRTGDVEWPDGTASRADAVDRAGGYTIKADQQRARDAD